MTRLREAFLYGYFLLFLLGAVLVAGSAATYWNGQRTDQEIRSDLLKRTATVATTIQPNFVMALTASDQDLANPEYLRIKELLIALHRTVKDIRFYYLARKIDNNIVLLCDSEPPDSPDYSPPGQIYNEAGPEFRTVIEGSPPVVIGPWTDRWGTWVSGIVPIKDNSGHILAVLGADIDARNLKNRIMTARLMPMAITLLSSIVLILLYLEQRRERRIHENLFENAERFRHTFDLSPVGAAMVAMDYSLLNVNEAFCRFIGYEETQLIGLPFLSLQPNEDQPATLERLDAMQRGLLDGFQKETRYLHKNGSIVWGQLSIRLIRNESGKPLYFLPVVVDISERKKADEELIQSEAKFARAFQSNPALMSISTLEEGRFINVNASFSTILGYAKDDVIGRTVSELNLYADPKQRQTLLKQIHQFGHVRDFEVTLRARSGDLRFGLFSIDTLDIQGTPHLLTVMHDFTERKRAEEELRKTRDYLDKLFNYANAPIIVWDRSLQITRFNHAFERLTGYAADEILGQHLGALLPIETREQSLLKIESTLHGEFWETVDIPIRRQDGAVRSVLWNSANILDDDQATILATIAQGVDITDHVHLEEQLAQAHRMESIGRLAGGVAHDFNNVLAVILGYSDLILQDLTDDASWRNELKEIKAAGERAKDVTRQLLAFSRKQVLEFRTMDPNALLEGIEKMIRRLLGENIEIVITSTANIGHIFADASQMEQVLLNLCINARDAMPHGGRLTIETGNLLLKDNSSEKSAGLAPGRYIVFRVRDTGMGMDEHTQRQIFEPFFTTKGKGKGTGLGLATVYGTVKQHGGDIQIHSEPGKGTTFEILLPQLENAPIEAPPVVHEKPLRGNGEIILVVEDDETVRKIIQQMLQRLGYSVLMASTADECMQYANNTGPIDLLIADVIMPQMNGPEIRDYIDSIRPGIKVLFMSGYTEDFIAHHGVLDTQIHFLAKPFTEGELSKKVREALDAS